MPINVNMAKLEVYNVTQHAAGIVINKQVKGKILAKRINVHTEHIKYAKSQESFLKNDQKIKEAREKTPCVQLKPCLLHPVRPTLSEPRENSRNSWHRSLRNQGVVNVKVNQYRTNLWTIQPISGLHKCFLIESEV